MMLNDFDPYNTAPDGMKGMDDDDRVVFCCCNIAATLMVFLLTLVVCALLGSCGTQERVVTVTAHTTDTLRMVQTRSDSIYMHDSIYMRSQGDTMLIERWHTRYHDRTVHDTVTRATHDTIPQPYEVVREVPASLTWWQRARLVVGDIALTLAAAGTVFVVVRRRLRRQ